MKKSRNAGRQGARGKTRTNLDSARGARGIFLVRVRLCEAVLDNFDGWSVTFEFDRLAPGRPGEVHKLTLGIGPDHEEKALACRVFAVLGATVWDDADLALACREVVGRHAYIHIGEAGCHVLQLATTHSVAAPAWAEPSLSTEDDSPAMSHKEERDLSDPDHPRFHSCDLAQKGDLRLHEIEHKRARRAREREEN